ncbi:MAG: hypothetical protein R3Y09_12085 [Clostridia bacterium]
MNIIEALFFGNIDPNSMPTDNKNYAQALEKVCENEELLSKILSTNEKRLLNEMINAYDTLTGETAVSNFTSGFKIGARFMLDIKPTVQKM